MWMRPRWRRGGGRRRGGGGGRLEAEALAASARDALSHVPIAPFLSRGPVFLFSWVSFPSLLTPSLSSQQMMRRFDRRLPTRTKSNPYYIAVY